MPMRRVSFFCRILSLLLTLALPNPAFALRDQEISEKKPEVLSGLEEALHGNPDQLVQLANTALGLPSSSVTHTTALPAVIPLRSAAGMEEVPHRSFTVLSRKDRHGQQIRVALYRIQDLEGQPPERLGEVWAVSGDTRVAVYADTQQTWARLSRLDIPPSVRDHVLLVPVPAASPERAEMLVRHLLSLEHKVAVVGVVVEDDFVQVDQLPPGIRESGIVSRHDEALAHLRKQVQMTLNGGTSRNLAEILEMMGRLDLARPSGLGVHHVGWIGDDDAGKRLKRSLSDLGVNVDGMQVSPDDPSAWILVLTLPGAERVFLYTPGASGKLTAADVTTVHYQCDVLGISGAEGTANFMPGVLSVLRTAKEHGQIVTWDTVVDPLEQWRRFSDEEFREILSLIDVFTPSIDEARAIIRQRMQQQGRSEAEAAKFADAISPEEASEYFIKLGSRAVFLKAGKRGSFIRTRPNSIYGEELARWIPTLNLQEAEIVDGTGAGDAYAAAVIKGVLMGLSAEGTALMASATGGLAVQQLGGTLGNRGFLDVLEAMDRLKAQVSSGMEERQPVKTSVVERFALSRKQGHEDRRSGYIFRPKEAGLAIPFAQFKNPEVDPAVFFVMVNSPEQAQALLAYGVSASRIVPLVHEAGETGLYARLGIRGDNVIVGVTVEQAKEQVADWLLSYGLEPTVIPPLEESPRGLLIQLMQWLDAQGWQANWQVLSDRIRSILNVNRMA